MWFYSYIICTVQALVTGAFIISGLGLQMQFNLVLIQIWYSYLLSTFWYFIKYDGNSDYIPSSKQLRNRFFVNSFASFLTYNTKVFNTTG